MNRAIFKHKEYRVIGILGYDIDTVLDNMIFFDLQNVYEYAPIKTDIVFGGNTSDIIEKIQAEYSTSEMIIWDIPYVGISRMWSSPYIYSNLAGTSITFLNSKGEIQEAMEELAAEFTDETGIEVEVLACGTGEVPYTKVTSAYNSGNAPTMSMLDTTDALALADEYAMDLSGEEWVSECGNNVTKVDGKVVSFPFCVEGRGLIVNKTAIEDTLGKDFDPDSINSYDALKSLLEELKAAGMESPVVISKEDWPLGAHQLGYIYDTYRLDLRLSM